MEEAQRTITYWGFWAVYKRSFLALMLIPVVLFLKDSITYGVEDVITYGGHYTVILWLFWETVGVTMLLLYALPLAFVVWWIGRLITWNRE